MDECPHCGEAIEENAEHCRHCGSNAETGWNPDSDYASVELPEDEVDSGAEEEESSIPTGWAPLGHLALIALAGVAFLALNALAYPGSALPFTFFALLAISFLIFHRHFLPRPKRPK